MFGVIGQGQSRPLLGGIVLLSAVVGLAVGFLAALGWRFAVPRVYIDAAPPPTDGSPADIAYFQIRLPAIRGRAELVAQCRSSPRGRCGRGCFDRPLHPGGRRTAATSGRYRRGIGGHRAANGGGWGVLCRSVDTADHGRGGQRPCVYGCSAVPWYVVRRHRGRGTTEGGTGATFGALPCDGPCCRIGLRNGTSGAEPQAQLVALATEGSGRRPPLPRAVHSGGLVGPLGGRVNLAGTSSVRFRRGRPTGCGSVRARGGRVAAREAGSRSG